MADEHKVADPGPLGLAAFATTTFALSSANAHLWGGAGATAAVSLALFYGGLTQLFAGMWEFVRKNTFGALAFSSYGAFWLSVYAFLNFQKGSGASLGVFLLCWTIFTAYMMIASFRLNNALIAVFVVLLATFIFLTIGNWGAGHESMVKVGGWLGIITAVIAWYTSAAGVINDTFKKVVLPVGPRG